MEAFGVEEEFEVYAMFDRDAIELLENRANVVFGIGLVKQANSELCVL